MLYFFELDLVNKSSRIRAFIEQNEPNRARVLNEQLVNDYI